MCINSAGNQKELLKIRTLINMCLLMEEKDGLVTRRLSRPLRHMSLCVL